MKSNLKISRIEKISETDTHQEDRKNFYQPTSFHSNMMMP